MDEYSELYFDAGYPDQYLDNYWDEDYARV